MNQEMLVAEGAVADEHVELKALLVERTQAPLRPGAWGPKGRLLAGALLAVVAWGLFAWSRQVRGGLEVTGMRDRVSWGIYITNFVFFIGISHAGTLVSAILRISKAEWRRPITRLAEMITVVALMVGGSMIIADLGRPERALNILRFPHLRSPILWDLMSVTTYLTGSIMYLYLPLIPDLAALRDSRRIGGIPRRIYGALSLRWSGLPEQRARLEKAIGIMMIVIVPVAVSVHTVVSWIFGMTLREGWNSTIFGPYFVVGAIFSGIAGIIVVMAIFRRVYKLHDFITDQHFGYLGTLLLVLALLYAYFTFSEYITIGYKLRVGDDALLHELLLGRYALPFWFFAIGGTLVPILLLSFRRTRTIQGLVVAAILVNVGMWLKRFVIVVPSLALPLMPYEWGVYRPTWIEWSITAGAFAGFALIFMLLARVFPVVSGWEVEEGWEIAGARSRPEPAAHRVLSLEDAAVPVAAGDGAGRRP